MRSLYRFAAGACAASLLALGCSRNDGNIPVGEDGASVVEQERYLRRLHIDLAGVTPTDEALAKGIGQLASDGNSAATRRAIAHELMAAPAFSEVFVSELHNRAFEGESLRSRYNFMCFNSRTLECGTQCSQDVDDPCADCACSPLPTFLAERTSLESATADFAAGATTSAIERRYAQTSGFRFPLGPDAVASLLFETFLGRPVEEEEQRNAGAMVTGSFIPGAPAGLLFHQHGENYEDLVNIVYGSEPYRDATVDGVFGRYLGRSATPAELGHFSSRLDLADPDLRETIESAVSSQEYFEQ